MGFQAASGLAPRRSWTHRWIPRKSWARWVRSPGVGLGQRTSSWWIVTFWTIYLEILEDFWCFNGRCIKKISEMIPGHNRSKYIPVKNILQTPYMWLYICIWLQMNNYIKHPNWFKTAKTFEKKGWKKAEKRQLKTRTSAPILLDNLTVFSVESLTVGWMISNSQQLSWHPKIVLEI